MDLQDVMTTREAAVRWQMAVTTIRKSCYRGYFWENEARKSADEWLITVSGMERLFGPAEKPAEGIRIPLADVRTCRDQFPPGTLWKQGRHWYTTKTTFAHLFHPNKET